MLLIVYLLHFLQFSSAYWITVAVLKCSKSQNMGLSLNNNFLATVLLGQINILKESENEGNSKRI